MFKKVTKKNPLILPTSVKAIYGFIYSLFWVFVPIFLVKQGFSGYHIGLFIGIANFMAIITALPAGIANDRLRSKKMILYALIFSALYYVGLLTTTNAIILAFAFICGGLGRNLFNVSIDSLAYRTLNRKKMPTQLGKYVGYAVFAEIVGFMIGGNVINSYGFENTLKVIIIMLIITGFAALFLPITHTFKFKLFEYKKDIFRKEVLMFIVVVFLFSLHYGAEATSYSLFLKTNFALDIGQIGIFVGGAIIFLALSVLYYSRKIAKGFDPKYVFYIGLIVSGIGHIIFALQQDVILAFIARSFHEWGDGAMIFSIFYGIVRIFKIERIGGNASFITFTSILGTSVSAFIFGPIGEHFGYHVPLFVTGITTLCSFLLLYYLQKRTLQKA
ncbi:MFS transporter [Patescibacteria group bacterium]